MLFELVTGPDSELAERLAQVIVDRARADEQPCGDLSSSRSSTSGSSRASRFGAHD
jgi:hypothetical protein